MKTQSPQDLETLYRRTLLPRLLAMKPAQEALQKKLMTSFVVVIGGAAYLLGAGVVPVQGAQTVLFIAVISCFFLYHFLIKSFRRRFKKEIIANVFQAFFESCHYEPDGYISQDDFVFSELFSTCNRYSGEDRIDCIFHGRPMRLSELTALRQTGSGKKRNTVTVFRGVFFRFSLPRNFMATVLIRPDTSEKVLGKLVSRFLQKNLSFTDHELVELESPDFEAIYTVRSNSQQRARLLLNPAIMQRLVHFSKKYPKQPVALSVKGDQLSVALSLKRNLFEPPIFADLANMRDVIEIKDLLDLINELLTAINGVQPDAHRA